MTLGTYVMVGITLGVAAITFTVWRPSDGETFAEPARAAIERLQFKRRAVDGLGLGGLTIESAGTDRGTLRIRVTRAGDPRDATCRVTVTPASPDTSHVRTDCTQPDASDQAMRRLGADALAIVVREHVAATIENRTYDVDRVVNRMIAFVVMNRQAMIPSMPPHKP